MTQPSDIYFEDKDLPGPRSVIFTFLEFFTIYSGILEKAKYYAGVCFIDYKGGYSLVINGCSKEFYRKLQQYFGEHIGIQHTNVPGYEYIIRRMRNPHHYNTKKKRNGLNPDQLHEYMRMYRKGIRRGAHTRTKVKSHTLSEYNGDRKDEVK